MCLLVDINKLIVGGVKNQYKLAIILSRYVKYFSDLNCYEFTIDDIIDMDLEDDNFYMLLSSFMLDDIFSNNIEYRDFIKESFMSGKSLYEKNVKVSDDGLNSSDSDVSSQNCSDRTILSDERLLSDFDIIKGGLNKKNSMVMYDGKNGKQKA